MSELPTGGLVLYKGRPACVKKPGEGRLEIETESGLRRVRPKDVTLLHPGPCGLGDLASPGPVEPVEAVRELLHGEPSCDLATLAELLFGDLTPAAAWASWQLVADGLHFSGSPGAVLARSPREVDEERRRRERAASQARAWTAFVDRVRRGGLAAEDDEFLRPLEDLALGRRLGSSLLKELGRAETAENAHALLLEVGRWSAADVPYAARAGLSREAPRAAVGDPAPEPRRDLTHLPAFAIDDEGSGDPDDAVSLDEDGALWVHVADASDPVAPETAADREARDRGATLYLPDGPVPMLPRQAVDRLGLGLGDRGESPALSFRLILDDDGSIAECRFHPSRVRVERLSYAAAQVRLGRDAVLDHLVELTERTRARRMAAGAVDLQWPEARIRVSVGTGEPVIDIDPLVYHPVRRMVAEAMVLAGEGTARLAVENGVALPFSVQEAHPVVDGAHPAPEGSLAAAFALRRRQTPARVSGAPAPHGGLGLPAYVRVTSPLRRYVDLLAHQQLRAWAAGAEPLEEGRMLARAVQAEAAAGAVRRTERLANRHWTLVWLQQRPGWRGEAELIDVRGRRGLVVIPDLALEAPVSLPPGGRPGSRYEVTVRQVDLPRLDLHLEMKESRLEGI